MTSSRLSPRHCVVAAAFYAVLTAILLSYTWHFASPEYHGFDWFWVAILTLPWSAVLNGLWNVPVPAAVMVGIFLNAGIIYLLGHCWRG